VTECSCGTTEQWRAVVGWEGFYEVSSCGRVRSLDRLGGGGERRPHSILRGKVLVQSPLNRGRLSVQLRRRGYWKRLQVHRLVALAFLGPCPPELVCCHNDGNHLNNHVQNLRWDTRSENEYDKVRHGQSHTANRTHCPKGHEYTDENTYRSKRGWRQCKTCSRAKCAAYNARKKAEHAA